MKQFLSYQEASQLAQHAKITTRIDYLAWYKQVKGMPSDPVVTYSKDWISWSVFLTGQTSLKKCSYARAGEIAREHKVRKMSQYRALTLSHPELPREPNRFYKDEWIDFTTFVTPPGVAVLAYEDARVELARLGVNTLSKYRVLVNTDLRFPLNPAKHYRDDWKGADAFFGREKPAEKYSYQQAQAAAIKLGIQSFNDYIHAKMYQLDPALPSTPQDFYKDEWTTWDDFLDVNNATRKTLSAYTFEEAKAVVKKFGLSRKRDYLERYQQDRRLYASPKAHYPEWISWPDYLGSTSQFNLAKVPFTQTGYDMKEVLKIVKNLNSAELEKLIKKLSMIHENKVAEEAELSRREAEAAKVIEDARQKIMDIAKACGVTIEQLGFSQNVESESVAIKRQNKRPAVSSRRPYKRRIEKQIFEIHGNELGIVFSHQAKKLLAEGKAKRYGDLTENQKLLANEVLSAYHANLGIGA